MYVYVNNKNKPSRLYGEEGRNATHGVYSTFISPGEFTSRFKRRFRRARIINIILSTSVSFSRYSPICPLIK